MKKRKFAYVAAAALMALSLAACSNSNQSSSQSSSKASSFKVEKKTSESSKSSKTNNNNNSSSKTNSSKSSSSAKKPSSQAPQARFSDLTSKLRQALPDMLLPTRDGLGQGSDHVNVRYTKNGNKSVVYYSVGNSAADFNTASVANEKPYAVLTETKNGDADSIINYSPEQKGLPTKKLDSDTTATTQGAAGQRYLQWNKGKYSFVIQASAQLKQDPTDKGQKVLALSKQYTLPDTSSHGSVHVIVGDSVGSLNTIIAWQNGNNVYQIKAHDTETAFKMLSSLK